MIPSLQDAFILEKEEEMAGFLGIQIVRDSVNNTITMTQNGLIDRILAAMNMEDCNFTYTSVEKDPLCKDEVGTSCCEH